MLSDDSSLLPTPALQQWSDFTIEGTSKVGQSITAASEYKKPLGEASFINVVETRTNGRQTPGQKIQSSNSKV
jgi:hypothetical protein